MTERDRFVAAGNGVVRDMETGLEWVAGPDSKTKWHQAKTCVAGMKVGGGRWRMPTIAEMNTLYQQCVVSGAGQRTQVFRLLLMIASRLLQRMFLLSFR